VPLEPRGDVFGDADIVTRWLDVTSDYADDALGWMQEMWSDVARFAGFVETASADQEARVRRAGDEH
jgi:hypothetical protein